jgi:hypothetical protein
MHNVYITNFLIVQIKFLVFHHSNWNKFWWGEFVFYNFVSFTSNCVWRESKDQHLIGSKLYIQNLNYNEPKRPQQTWQNFMKYRISVISFRFYELDTCNNISVKSSSSDWGSNPRPTATPPSTKYQLSVPKASWGVHLYSTFHNWGAIFVSITDFWSLLIWNSILRYLQ